MRFKIDFNPDSGCSRYSSFVLSFAKPTWFGPKWERLDSFESVEKAREHYEKIKDMPEYLP